MGTLNLTKGSINTSQLPWPIQRPLDDNPHYTRVHATSGCGHAPTFSHFAKHIQRKWVHRAKSLRPSFKTMPNVLAKI